ncbi:MAG: type 4a pilus biogenesis protein PilO [Candidatus Omnitrophota bacterium]
MKKKEYKMLEAGINEGRDKLILISKIDKAQIESRFDLLNKRLPLKSSISAMLEELTDRGKELNIEFISVTPIAEKTITLASREGKATYRVLPIEINMRAGYKDLGEYMGVLENLESSFATISEFQINKDESRSPSGLKVRMILYTYMSSAENKNE